MTVELAMFISMTAMLLNVISLWALSRARGSQKDELKNVWQRLHYLELSLHHHGLTPLPWEMEEFEETKSFKQEGNVVYLEKKGKKYE